MYLNCKKLNDIFTSQILFLGVRIRRTRGSQPRQLSLTSDSSENGRMGIGSNQSFPEILSRRVPLQDVRGTIEEDHHGPGVHPSMARQDQIQETEMAVRRVRRDFTTSHTWMAVEETFLAGDEKETRGGGSNCSTKNAGYIAFSSFFFFLIRTFVNKNFID